MYDKDMMPSLQGQSLLHLQKRWYLFENSWSNPNVLSTFDGTDIEGELPALKLFITPHYRIVSEVMVPCLPESVLPFGVRSIKASRSGVLTLAAEISHWSLGTFRCLPCTPYTIWAIPWPCVRHNITLKI